MGDLVGDLRVIDVDAHMTERHDLFTGCSPCRSQHLVDAVGEDNIMFETDFPHPTCLHPNPVEAVSPRVASLRPETQRKVMGDNAAALYRL